MKEQQSLFFMNGTRIHCGREFEFTVEFPDFSNCAKKHEQNYQKYAVDFGISDARYLPIFRAEYQPIGVEHKNVVIYKKKKGYGTVHKALNNKTARFFAIKILDGGGESEMKEVNILSRLCPVNLCICLLCVKY